MWPLTKPRQAPSPIFSPLHLSISIFVPVCLMLVGAFRGLKASVFSSFFLTNLGSPCRRRNHKWSRMFCRQWVWGLFSFRAFLIYSDLGIDLVKLLSLKSPNTWITWHLMSWTIRFDFTVGCSDGIMAPSFMSPQTSPVANTLPN